MAGCARFIQKVLHQVDRVVEEVSIGRANVNVEFAL